MTDFLDVMQLVEQAEAEDLANSILIEISAGAVKSWRERLQTRYGWFKSDNCKNLIFEVIYCLQMNGKGMAMVYSYANI